MLYKKTKSSNKVTFFLKTKCSALVSKKLAEEDGTFNISFISGRKKADTQEGDCQSE